MGNRIIYLFFMLLATGCGIAGIDSTLDAGQKKVQPIVKALESYRNRHKTYPDSLDVLVRDGQITEIPKLPNVEETFEVFPLDYSVAPDGSFYYLTFAYDFPEGFGPGSIITRYYISDEKKWRTAKYPPSFDSLVADRSGRIYIEQKSFESLKTVVDRVLANADLGVGCVNLFESYVTERLGPGEAIKLPENLRSKFDTRVRRYTSNDVSQPSYVFVFKAKVMPGGNSGGSISDQEYQVARAVFEVEPQAKDSSEWKFLAECR